ncbi:MAG: SIS domain-containing protein [Rhodospirillaceae bacterium]|nr:SIS domain-containing protein [Rhodospirillaceae bacterium]
MNDQPTTASSEFAAFATSYFERLTEASNRIPLDAVKHLADALMSSWQDGRQVFIFGNGGSAGNAMHLANDWIYGISKTFGSGLRVTALPSNGSVTTCLANDEGYESIYSYQLAVLARPGDIAIALSGSGNSPNIVKALEYCKEAGIESYAILGYTGGKALALADHPIHVAIDDMQISEDLQMTVGHLLMQWLYAKRSDIAPTWAD